jgi:hypothetical protein
VFAVLAPCRVNMSSLLVEAWFFLMIAVTSNVNVPRL